MREYGIGDLQSLLHTQQQRPGDEDTPAIQLYRDAWGFFGARITNLTHEPFFVSCEELLGLAAFLERHLTWIEEHAEDNAALYDNEVGGPVYVWLQRKNHPFEKRVLLLTTENRFAWYGGSPLQTSEEPPDERTRTTAFHERQEYLRVDWEEYADRTVALVEESA